MTDNLKLLGLPQVRAQLTAPLHDILCQIHVNFCAPVAILPAASKDYAPAVWPRKYICRGWIQTLRAAEVHARDGRFRLSDKNRLTSGRVKGSITNISEMEGAKPGTIYEN